MDSCVRTTVIRNSRLWDRCLVQMFRDFESWQHVFADSWSRPSCCSNSFVWLLIFYYLRESRCVVVVQVTRSFFVLYCWLVIGRSLRILRFTDLLSLHQNEGKSRTEGTQWATYSQSPGSRWRQTVQKDDGDYDGWSAIRAIVTFWPSATDAAFQTEHVCREFIGWRRRETVALYGWWCRFSRHSVPFSSVARCGL